MVLRGNLLYNGDFETGTTEGWETGIGGLNCDFNIAATWDAAYKGGYGGSVYATKTGATGYIGYDKMCSFEEYDAYLGIMYVKMIDGFCHCGVLYGFDDKGEFLRHFNLGWNIEEGKWLKFLWILRGFSEITHFKIGHFFNGGGSSTPLYYIDEAKLIGLRSIKGHEIKEVRFFDNLTTDKSWHSCLACIGRCRLRSLVNVVHVSGTDPTLSTNISIFNFDITNPCYTITHTVFTQEEVEEKIIDLPDISVIEIHYDVNGTNPSFDFYHSLVIEPY
ncbi:MAG: hypothetical protein DRI61_10990 [Chloroflexi bacterium]|nr:MAG: hypothetical protein DRI61_10990 [Chloroflexota bacterium]